MKYFLDGQPIPLARHRSSISTGKCYDAQKNLKLIQSISLHKQHKTSPLLGPLSINIIFFMKIPKLSKPKQKTINGTPDPHRPDLDNLIKFVLDVSNGIIFKDDSQIVKIIATKIYSDKPHTEFIIETER